MNQPKIFADSGWKQSWIELTVLFALTVVATVIILKMHWLLAMVVAPFIMLAMLAVIMGLVQVLWMFVVGLDHLGAAAGLRKSPLS